MAEITVRKFKLADLDDINRIAQGLHPEWGTEEALANIPRDIQFAKCFVAELEKSVVGFISVHSYDGRPMIGWLGAEKKLRRKRVGRHLVERVVLELKNLAIEISGFRQWESANRHTNLMNQLCNSMNHWDSRSRREEG